MISHVAEVWVALFAAFVVGSLLGWLIYRWVDRSDFAFHHHDADKPVPRRRGDAVPTPVPAEARRPPQRQPVPRQRPAPVARESAAPEPTAAATVSTGALRSRIGPAPPPERTGVRGPRPAPAAAPSPAQRPIQAPPPVAPQRAADTPPALSPAARLLRARSLPPVERTGTPVPAPAAAERPQAPPRIDMPLPAIAPSSVQHEEPWQARSEPWPIERRAPSAPSGGLPTPTTGRAVILDNHPKHEEIWSSGDPKSDAADEPVGQTPAALVDDELHAEPERIVWQPAPEPEPHPELEEDYRDAPSLSALVAEEAATEAPGVAPNDIVEAVRPPSVPPPSRPDDFKQIKGIGPAFERKLNQLGIYHYVQIAAWSPAEQAWVGNEFGFTGRIERDDWVGQAAALAAEAAAATVSNPARD